MKKLIIAFCALLVLPFLSCTKTEMSQEGVNGANFKGILKERGNVFVFGTRCHPCGEPGCYCVGDRGLCIIIRIDKILKSAIKSHSFLPNSGAGEITLLSNNQLKLSMLYDNSSINEANEPIFYITQDMEFPNAVVDGTLVVLAGEYTIDYSTNPLGDIIVDYVIK
mgnify:CR=1 FL=1|jgi:hypothetical protein